MIFQTNVLDQAHSRWAYCIWDFAKRFQSVKFSNLFQFEQTVFDKRECVKKKEISMI